jgi:hypothetical protein
MLTFGYDLLPVVAPQFGQEKACSETSRLHSLHGFMLFSFPKGMIMQSCRSLSELKDSCKQNYVDAEKKGIL